MSSQAIRMPSPFQPGVLLVKGNYGLAGGPETLIASIANNLDQSRFRPALVVLHRDGVPESPQLGVDCLPIDREDLQWPGLAGAVLAARHLQATIRSRQTSLLHTHDMRSNLTAALVRGMGTRIPWVAHVHGWLGHTQTGKWRWYERLDKRLVCRADLVLVGSEAARREVEAAGARLVEVLPNAVEIPPQGSWTECGQALRAELGIPSGTVLAGIVGRVHAGKGQRLLLQSIAALRREGLDIRGAIVGGGPDLDGLRVLAEELGIADAVWFPGFCRDATPWVAAMDIFAVPSLKESLPLALLEAMALQRAVVASEVGDIPNVLRRGLNGLLVPPGDAEALASAIRALAVNPEMRLQFAAAARKTVEERFSADSMSRKLEACYLSLLERART